MQNKVSIYVVIWEARDYESGELKSFGLGGAYETHEEAALEVYSYKGRVVRKDRPVVNRYIRCIAVSPAMRELIITMHEKAVRQARCRLDKRLAREKASC